MDSGTMSLEKVNFRYPTGFALEDITLEIPRQSFLALIGPNGSGKTTLLHLMSKVLQPDRGQVYLDGKSLAHFTARELSRRIAVISSEQHFQFPFPVFEVVAMGRFPYLGRLQKMSKEDWEIVDEALRMTRTDELRERPISQLSSGERQRVLIARAIAQRPSVLILDEPNAHLDINHQIAIFQLLQFLNEKHAITEVMVLHDLAAAAAFCKSVALLHQGELVKQGTPQEVITAENIRNIYGAEVVVSASESDGVPQIRYARPGATDH